MFMYGVVGVTWYLVFMYGAAGVTWYLVYVEFSKPFLSHLFETK